MSWVVWAVGAVVIAVAVAVGWVAYNPPYEDESDYEVDMLNNFEDDEGPGSEGYVFNGPEAHEVAALQNEEK